MKYLFWVASYPKSGNTWMRIFLANLQKRDAEPIDINATFGDYPANSRELFDHFSGLENTLLTDLETLKIRHQIYESFNATLTELTFLKTHALYSLNSKGERLFPSQASQGAIYLIRNPLDLAASFASHSSLTLNKSIKHMGNDNAALGDNRKLIEPISSWRRNVLSWVDECEFPLLIVRYEDLVLQPFETFSRAAHFAGLSEDPDQIKQAIKNSNFDALQKQEQLKGFREKPPEMGKFFRKGKVGSWHEELSPAQAKRIIRDHGDVMRKFGYLTKEGEPVY